MRLTSRQGASVILATCSLGFTAAELDAQLRPLGPRDVVRLPQIVEVQLAPDGRQVVFAVEIRDPDKNRTSRSVQRVLTTGDSAALLPIDARASQLRWRPDGAGMSYLAPDTDGVTQVWLYTPGSGSRMLTAHPEPILSHEWSPDGRRLAFTAAVVLTKVDTAEAGVLIDNVRFFHSRLLEKQPVRQYDSHYGDPPTRHQLWIQEVSSGRTQLVSDSLSVSTFAWSPTSHSLAVAARGELGRLPSHFARHDLMLYSLDDRRLEVLLAGSGGDYMDGTVIYDQPFWSPDGRMLGYFRRDMRDRWEASPQLGVFSMMERRTVFFKSAEQFETYRPRAWWLHADTVLVENVYRGSRRLFALALADSSVTPVINSDEWFDYHSFSRDGRFVAFVRERIDTPGDLYVWDRADRRGHRLTDLHAALTGVQPPHVERIRWPGEDGIPIEGWLYLPFGKPPFPAIVFVHAGPTWVFTNRYEPSVSLWPQAFGVYAARGIAVFVPNYRGTASYGKAFRRRSALDAEPVTDIMSGLDTLVSRGIVDPHRVGIAGHSHGCWLAPLIAGRYRRFAAGACAEGMADWASIYGRNAGWMNSEIVEHYWGDGASPYDRPARYRRLSPIYGFRGLRTPFLFEAGEFGQVLGALEYATAAWRFGVPHELIIYRDTDHNVLEPRVMLEVMQRNLEWFEFWLLGREHPGESKWDQYRRWRKLEEKARG